MEERITLILKTKNVNASQFADEIGVQRSSISHVLSGRNKPSLEFVQKILKRYPDINPDWLLFGKGQMYQETNLFSSTSEIIPIKEEAISRALGRQGQSLAALPEKGRSSLHEIKPDKGNKSEDQTIIQDTAEVEGSEVAYPPVIESTKKGDAVAVQPPLKKEIEKILVFFTDRSFREYHPD